MNTSPDTVQDRIDRYTPTVLAPGVWQRLEDQVRGVVASSGPTSPEDAKQLLVALCAYVAWQLRQGVEVARVTDVLHERGISAFAAEVHTSTSPKTARNYLGRLRRLMRSELARDLASPDLAGATAADAPARRARTRPYTADEVAALRASRSVDLDTALLLGLDAGVVVPTIYEVAIDADDPRQVRHRDRTMTLPRPVAVTRLDRAWWERARRAAARTGVGLDSLRLHATWAAHQARCRRSTSSLVAEGLTRPEIDAIARERPELTDDDLRSAR